MLFFKVLVLATALFSLTPYASAEVQTRNLKEKCAAGDFIVDVPRVVLESSEARQLARTQVAELVEKFRYQAEKIGKTEVKYHVTAENESYVSIFMESTAYYEGAAHPEKEFHALVLDKATGSPLPLSNFIKIPNLTFLKEQNSFGNVIVTASDGQTKLDNSLVDELRALPTEYILDRAGNVYLLATEMTIYATGTPLILLPISNFHATYVTKG